MNSRKGKTMPVKHGASVSLTAKVQKADARRKGGIPLKHGGAGSAAGRKVCTVKASSALSGKCVDAEVQGGKKVAAPSSQSWVLMRWKR